MSPRRALLQHLWAMIQTRAEAVGLVLELQRTALAQSLLFGAIAAVTGLSFLTAVIVWIAVVAPAAWRGTALALVALALLATAVYGALSAGRRLRHDANLIADFSRGLKLDLAMINLALAGSPTQEEGEPAVRAAVAETAGARETAEGGGLPPREVPAETAADPPMEDAARASTSIPRASRPTPVEREMPDPLTPEAAVLVDGDEDTGPRFRHGSA